VNQRNYLHMPNIAVLVFWKDKFRLLIAFMIQRQLQIVQTGLICREDNYSTMLIQTRTCQSLQKLETRTMHHLVRFSINLSTALCPLYSIEPQEFLDKNSHPFLHSLDMKLDKYEKI
jgi:hypothetical protein